MFDQTQQFHVLAVDDDADMLAEIERELRSLPEVAFCLANTQEQAIELLRCHYFDLAIVDIVLGEDEGAQGGGYEVLREMAERAPNAHAIIASAFGVERGLAGFVGSTRPRIRTVVAKDEGGEWVAELVDDAVKEWQRSAIDLKNLQLAMELLSSDKRRRRIRNIREDEALAVEIDRLCRQLFGDVTGVGGAGVSVRLDPIDRQGLSAAVTVQAEVQLGRDRHGNPVPGTTCVLKLGPCADIQEEVERYEQFVKYGVRLRHRVELLGHAYDQSLGAISYSFAGGVFGESLTSLDQILSENHEATLFEDVLEHLFADDTENKNWYAVDGPELNAIKFVRESYSTNFEHCAKVLNSVAKNLQNRYAGKVAHKPHEKREHGELRVEQTKLIIPKAGIWGTGPFVRAYPTCLVHGDLHGGNVMAEIADSQVIRVCLIDYRSAGPGPRSVDWVALEASVRLAHARRLIENTGIEHEEEMPDQMLLATIRQAADAERDEQKLFAHIWDGTPMPKEEFGWAGRIAEIARRARSNFDDLGETDYLAVAVPCAFRQIGYDIGTVARIRILAWISALCRRIDGLAARQTPSQSSVPLSKADSGRL
jgi:CheY-like chemotaxis protein/ribosomal protein S17E